MAANVNGVVSIEAQQLQSWAREFGFADAAVARLPLSEDLEHLKHWLAQGLHGEMAYMARDPEQRADPAQLQPGTVTVISARMDYKPAAADAWTILKDPERAYIARYALGRDYHKLLRSRLKKLAEKISMAIAPHGYRVFTDSAPSLEKALARNAGLGWIGKNTLLMNREAGSWFLLGEIFTDLPLQPSAQERRSHCGSCTACLDICPTRAFIGPYQLDARRCISYLTIESRGPIPLELRPLIGNRIFGCDDCQLVCPWNRYAQLTTEPDFAPRHGLDTATLIALFNWSESEYLQRTEGMPLRRAGYSGWLRNLAVAMGNVPNAHPQQPHMRRALQNKLEDGSVLDDMVLEHIRWALDTND